MWTRTGTILYSAPEIFEGGEYNKKGSVMLISHITNLTSGHLEWSYFNYYWENYPTKMIQILIRLKRLALKMNRLNKFSNLLRWTI